MAKIKSNFFKYSKILFLIFLTLGLLWSALRLLPSSQSLIQSLTKIIRPVQLRSIDDRVNLLFLGVGGNDHGGSDLTDSLIFISIKEDNGATTFLSIPRDIWVDSMRAKINTAYHYGEKQKENGGLVLAKGAVSEILGQPIHYAVLVDFDGFVKAIDLMGGLEVEVERSFDDYKYPIPGMETAQPEEARYEYLHFDQGWQSMDGTRALKYIRSRYAEGEEGTDFARSKRQQKILLAFKDKVFSAKTIFSPKKIKALMQVFSHSIKTDIAEEEYATFFKLALKVKNGKIKTAILEENLLINPPSQKYDGHWVLIPKSDDWREVHQYVKRLLI